VAEHDGAKSSAWRRHRQVAPRTAWQRWSLATCSDCLTTPAQRRHGIGWPANAIDDVLIARGVDGVYALHRCLERALAQLFAMLGYQRLANSAAGLPAFPAFDVRPGCRATRDPRPDHDLSRGPQLARPECRMWRRLKDYGFERWSEDLGNAKLPGWFLFDQTSSSSVAAELPFLSEEECTARWKSLLQSTRSGFTARLAAVRLFDTLRDLAVTSNVSKLTLCSTAWTAFPLLLLEAYKQWTLDGVPNRSSRLDVGKEDTPNSSTPASLIALTPPGRQRRRSPAWQTGRREQFDRRAESPACPGRPWSGGRSSCP